MPVQLPEEDSSHHPQPEQPAEQSRSFTQQRQRQQSILKAVSTSVASPVASKGPVSIRWPQFKDNDDHQQQQQQQTASTSFLKGIGDLFGGFGFGQGRSNVSTPLQQQLGGSSFGGFTTTPRSSTFVNSIRWASGPGRQSSAGSIMEGGSTAGSVTGSMSGSTAGGLKRGIMSLKSVKHVALSQAAKAAIISTIADNALASFLIIQVRIY
jgi:hypothetical protein